MNDTSCHLLLTSPHNCYIHDNIKKMNYYLYIIVKPMDEYHFNFNQGERD